MSARGSNICEEEARSRFLSSLPPIPLRQSSLFSHIEAVSSVLRPRQEAWALANGFVIVDDSEYPSSGFKSRVKRATEAKRSPITTYEHAQDFGGGGPFLPFKTAGKGWGTRAATQIPRSCIFAALTGTIRPTKASDWHNQYLANLGFALRGAVLDPTTRGSIASRCNHSCRANAMFVV